MITDPRRVLMVDDDESVRQIMHDFLLQLGWNTDLVASTQSALEALQQKAYSLVILDVHLKGHNGIEALGQIRSCHPNLPIIVTSGQDIDAEDIAKTLVFRVREIVPKVMLFKALPDLLQDIEGTDPRL